MDKFEENVIMKINRLEAHDRLLHLHKESLQTNDISECCQNLIDQRPFGNEPFYIFAHARTGDDGFTQRVIWQPRLTKPEPQVNSMLFKAYPGTDNIKIIWIIPRKELWEQYEQGQVSADPMIMYFIRTYSQNKDSLKIPEPDDLPDCQILKIYRQVAEGIRKKKAEVLFKC